MSYKLFFVLFQVFILGLTWAHPVQYKDAVAFMTWNQAFLNESWLTYSYTEKRAVAFRYMRVVTDDDEVNNFYMPQYDLLLKRWNGQDYQANIYTYAAIGVQHRPTRTGTAVLGGVEADWETRKYFIQGKSEFMGSDIDTGMEKYEFRLGVAPYESEFDEVGSWLMLQYQSHSWLSKKQALTPLARFMYKSVLWELGTSFEGDYMSNVMFLF